MKHYFIQIFFYNPASHETDWRIIGENNEEVYGEESAMLFNSEEEAQAWTKTDEAKIWRPCTFTIKESIY